MNIRRFIVWLMANDVIVHCSHFLVVLMNFRWIYHALFILRAQYLIESSLLSARKMLPTQASNKSQLKLQRTNNLNTKMEYNTNNDFDVPETS